jgi:hypothetical protein
MMWQGLMSARLHVRIKNLDLVQILFLKLDGSSAGQETTKSDFMRRIIAVLTKSRCWTQI